MLPPKTRIGMDLTANANVATAATDSVVTMFRDGIHLMQKKRGSISYATSVPILAVARNGNW